MGKNCLGLFLAVIILVSASCADNDQLKIKDNKGEPSITITTTKPFTKDQQIKLYNDSTFKLSATFGYDLKSVSYGIDGEFTVSQVAPNGNSWSQEVSLDPINTTNGSHTLKVIGTPKMDGVSTEQVMKFEVIDKPALSIKYDRKNTATKQPIKVTTSSPLETISMILPDGSRQPFKKQSPTSFSLVTVIPKGDHGLCRIQSTDEYGNSVTESLFVDMAEKRLWFINNGWDDKLQKRYHQLVSCNTDLQDVVVHMDTEEFVKLAADSEDARVLKGEGSNLKLSVVNLYGISSDKRFLFIAIESNTQNPSDYQMNVLKVNNFPIANVVKIKYNVYDIEQKNVLFSKHSYYYQYRDHDRDMQTSNGIDYAPLYFKDDSLYMIEQKRANGVFDTKSFRTDFLTDTNQYEIESSMFVKLSLKDSEYKYIDPLFSVLPWMTFNTQELGLVGMTDSKFIKKYSFPCLPVAPSDNYSNVSTIFNMNNSTKFDVVELNKKLCGDKCEIFLSHFVGAYNIEGKYYAIYYVNLKEYYEDPVAYKQRAVRLENTVQLTHYYLVSLDTGEVKDLPIDTKFQSLIFVRSNAIENEKAFFYLRKEPLSDERKLIQKEQYVKVVIESDEITYVKLQPDKNIKWFLVDIIDGYRGFRRNLSVFFQ